MLSKLSITKYTKNHNPLKTISEKAIDIKSIDVACWIRFLQEIKITKMFSSLSDNRQQGKVCYSSPSLLRWALSTCVFRLGSKNALQTSIEHLSSEQSRGMMNLLEIKEGRLPHSSTVDNFLAKTSLEELSQIPLTLLKQLEERKFFYNHSELLPDNSLTIGCDGYWIHAYDNPHAAHEDGSNACPCCLPRTYFKGTDKEVTKWVHVVITFTLICEGLTLPIFTYPLKAGQVDLEQSDEAFKEECELKAAHAVLPMIRAMFPRTKILFLGDALYANRPMIRLCNQLRIDYMIVLKENNLRNLNKKCHELDKTEIYQRYYRREVKESHSQGTVTKESKWFNEVAVGENVFTNVLKYEEAIYQPNGSSGKGYKGSWISSKKITLENCFKKTVIGRMRWSHEDLHNTGKNRGYEMKHDMSRTNPHLLFAWNIINFIAYFLFELFQHTVVALACRKRRSLMKFAKDMLEQLINISWDLIIRSTILSKPRVQFRYRFDSS